jgi:hypothetical protein
MSQGPVLPPTPSPLTQHIASAIDAYMRTHPGMGVREILQSLEHIRHSTTELVIREWERANHREGP